MIDNLTDVAVASYLKAATSGYPGLTVVVGIEDNNPNLATPYLVVHSAIQSFEGRNPVYKLRTTIEAVSLSGLETGSQIEAIMSVVDAALTSPNNAAIAQAVTTGLSYLGWEAVPASSQNPGDRRNDVRELDVFAQLAS